MSKRNGTLMDMFNVRKSKRTRNDTRVKKSGLEEEGEGQVAKRQVEDLTHEVEEEEHEVLPQDQKEKVQVQGKHFEKEENQHVEEEAPVDIDSFPYRKQLAAQEAKDDQSSDIPNATYRVVHYEGRGVSEGKLQTQFGKSPREIFNSNPNNCKVFQWIFDNFVIPEDFDRSLKYGARSGKCHEERVCSAWESGLLSARSPQAEGVEMCRTCGQEGHFLFDCPTKLQAL